MSAREWDHKEEWRKHGKNFMVTVSRHTRENYPGFGPNLWCVYAYVYPKHPYFAEFDGLDSCQPAAASLPMHGGPSLLRWHYDADGKPVSVQVGADYNHLYDGCCSMNATKDDARVQFADAQELFDWLQAKAEAA